MKEEKVILLEKNLESKLFELSVDTKVFVSMVLCQYEFTLHRVMKDDPLMRDKEASDLAYNRTRQWCYAHAKHDSPYMQNLKAKLEEGLPKRYHARRDSRNEDDDGGYGHGV